MQRITAKGAAILLLFVLVLLVFSLTPVNAQTITFSDLGLVDSQQLVVYNSSDGFSHAEAFLNTSGGTYNFDHNNSYQIVIRPASAKIWSSPKGVLDNLVSIVDNYGLQLLILAAIGVLIFRRR